MKRVLALLCALLLVLTALPAAVTAKETETLSLYQQVLLRDGFIEGVWYPWFTHDNLGNSFTTNYVAKKYITNAWYDFAKVGIDSYGADKIYAEIYNLKAVGYNMLAIAASAYGEGVLYDDYGDVIGIKQEYLDNARRFLNICREIGMPVMWNICFHSSSMPDYYGMDAWNIICRMYADPTVADHYADRFVRPVCEMLADYQDVVALVCLTDEIENEIHDNETGRAYGEKWFGTTKERIVYFTAAMNEVVKEELPAVDRIVAANADDLSAFAHLDLDVMGRNRYADDANCPNIEGLYATAPMLLTEYNIATANGMNEETYSARQIAFRENMKRDGYLGGFLWCWQPNAKGGAMDLLRKDAVTTTDFRRSVYDTYYYTYDNRLAHRGEKEKLEAPVLFFNEGNGVVEWIPSRQAVTLQLMRSEDGGASWQPLISDLQENYVVNGKGVYRDNVRNAMYKIAVWDAIGNMAVSEPTNQPGIEDKYVRTMKTISVDRYYRPTVTAAPVTFDNTDQIALTSFGVYGDRPVTADKNLITCGNFETAPIDAPWNTATFLGSTVAVVEDDTAPVGVKSLCFDTTDEETPRWRTFTVAVKPNTEYYFSAWVKGDYLSEHNTGYASIGVLNPSNGRFAVYREREGRASRTGQQIYPPAWDTEWHLRSVSFNSGRHTQVTVALYGYGTKMWVDDIALYESDFAKQFKSERSIASPRLSYLLDYSHCYPADSVAENPCFEDENSTYWQEGYGWKLGTLTIEKDLYGYGNALRYSASDNPSGHIYLKWFDVKPQTNYIVSFKYKVTETGYGKIRLVSDRVSNPAAFTTIDLRDVGYPQEDGWCVYAARYNTDVFDRIGLMITDLGGEAYIDNFRLFEVKDGVDGRDLYLEEPELPGAVVSGATTSVTVKAQGDGLKYAWYYKDKGAADFRLTTTFTGPTYSVKMNGERADRQVYCVVTDRYGVSRRTEEITLSMKPSDLKITKESATAKYAQLNEKAAVKVTAVGDGLKYQWYVKNSGASKYSKSSITKASYSVTMTDKVKNRRVYCVVTDAYGKKVQSKTFILRMAASISTQPKSVTVKKNTTAKVTVKAKGDGLKYQWYVKNEGAKKYSKSSITKSSYSVKMTAKVKNRLVYCVVTDKYGKTVKSSTVRLKMK